MHPVAALVIESWAELGRVIDGLSSQDALRQVHDGSSFAWTLAHLGQQLDSWINERLAHHEPEPFFQDERWRMGGTGAADDWAQIKHATRDVRRKARTYLESLDKAALNTKAP